MSEWGKIRLGDAIHVKHGFAFSGKYFGDDSELPQVVTPGNFALGGGFQEGKPKSYSGEIPESYILKPGDLMVTMTDLSKQADTLGLPALVPNQKTYLHNQRIGLIEVTDSTAIDPKFLNYFLRTHEYREYILGTASGSTVRHTSPARIENYVALVPNVAQQRAIAEVLGALDDKIAANSQLAQLVRQKAVLHVSQVPVSAKLEDIAELHKKTTDPERMEVDLVRHFSLPAFDVGKGAEVVDPKKIKSSKFLIDAPSVLVSKLNPRFPRIWDIPTLAVEPSVASTEFLVLHPLREESVEVLWAILSRQSFSAELASNVAGTSGSHQRVKPATVMAAAVVNPRELQPRLKELIKSHVQIAASHHQESSTLEELRDALLPQLMSGKLRVRDAEKIVSDAV